MIERASAWGFIASRHIPMAILLNLIKKNRSARRNETKITQHSTKIRSRRVIFHKLDHLSETQEARRSERDKKKNAIPLLSAEWFTSPSSHHHNFSFDFFLLSFIGRDFRKGLRPSKRAPDQCDFNLLNKSLRARFLAPRTKRDGRERERLIMLIFVSFLPSPTMQFVVVSFTCDSDLVRSISAVHCERFMQEALSLERLRIWMLHFRTTFATNSLVFPTIFLNFHF
jgi:hypothetical protein